MTDEETERRRTLDIVKAKAQQFGMHGTHLDELKEAFTSCGYHVLTSAQVAALKAPQPPQPRGKHK